MFNKKKIIITLSSIFFSLILIVSSIIYVLCFRKKDDEQPEEEKEINLNEYRKKYKINNRIIDEAQKYLTAYVLYVNEGYNYYISDPDTDTSIPKEIHEEYKKYENKNINKELDFLFAFHLKSIAFFGIVLFPNKNYFDEFNKVFFKDSELQKELINKETLKCNEHSIISTDEALKNMKEKIKEIKNNINKYGNKNLKINFSTFLKIAKKVNFKIKE